MTAGYTDFSVPAVLKILRSAFAAAGGFSFTYQYLLRVLSV
mgnify:CR=1 FL=1